jgi:hypothetical protein
MKIVLNMKDPRSRASPRHVGQGVFFVSYRSAAQEALSGAAAFIVSDGKRGTISASYLNTTIFTGYHLFLITFFGTSPATVAASHVISAENRFSSCMQFLI